MSANLTAPRPYADIIDRVCDRDRLYFEEHADDDSYWRDYAPGEFWPMTLPTSTCVEVVQVQPGVRLRRPVTPVHGERP
jgi:hypothetical protein